VGEDAVVVHEVEEAVGEGEVVGLGMKGEDAGPEAGLLDAPRVWRGAL